MIKRCSEEGSKAVYDRAYQKNNRTSVGMKISAAEVPEALARLAKISEGEHWEEVGFPTGSMYGTFHDIRSYYEELAFELADGPIDPWAIEQWFYDRTEAGQIILSAQSAIIDKNADHSIWFGLAPAGRE